MIIVSSLFVHPELNRWGKIYLNSSINFGVFDWISEILNTAPSLSKQKLIKGLFICITCMPTPVTGYLASVILFCLHGSILNNWNLLFSITHAQHKYRIWNIGDGISRLSEISRVRLGEISRSRSRQRDISDPCKSPWKLTGEIGYGGQAGYSGAEISCLKTPYKHPLSRE